jgi:hypothetical protein
MDHVNLESVRWFNNVRLLVPIGDIPTAEFEKEYIAGLDVPALAVGLTWNGSVESGAVHRMRSTIPCCCL